MPYIAAVCVFIILTVIGQICLIADGAYTHSSASYFSSIEGTRHVTQAHPPDWAT